MAIYALKSHVLNFKMKQKVVSGQKIPIFASMRHRYHIFDIKPKISVVQRVSTLFQLFQDLSANQAVLEEGPTTLIY